MENAGKSGAQSILVRAPNWIGDQILAYPFFHYLRKAHPKAHITSVCVPWVEDLQYRNLVDDVCILDRPAGKSLWDKLSAIEATAARLKAQRQWDLAVVLPNSLSSAWLAYRAGARKRTGYKVDGRGLLLNDARDWKTGEGAHRAQAYVDLMSTRVRQTIASRPVREFWGVPPENELDDWKPGEQSRFDAAAAWGEDEALAPPSGPYYVLAPGSNAPARRWPVESFSALSRQIHSKTGWKGVVVGGAAEALMAQRLCEDASLHLEDWTARAPVSALWKIFSGARVTISNDSGLAHVASLCGSPVHIVWGAGDPNRTEPIGPGKVLVTMNPVDCWPCERNTCSLPGDRQLQCLRGIRSDVVWEEIQRGFRV